MNYGLGRKSSVDWRDLNFPLAEHPKLKAARPYILTKRYWWSSGHWGDQGLSSQCVAYAWLHWMEDGPVTWSPREPGSGFLYDPAEIYRKAQRLDVWPGEDYNGTSVRAGAKVLKQLGVIKDYRWSSKLRDVIEAVLYVGPVVVGTDWHESMFTPDKDNFIKPTGGIAGGHAYVINGVNTKRGCFRIKNSWGREWGNVGHAYIQFGHFRDLMQAQGEVCLATEVIS